MTKTVNIREAKTHLSRLLEEAVAGEDIVIAKAGKPKVRLVPIEDPPTRRRGGAPSVGGRRVKLVLNNELVTADPAMRVFGAGILW